MSKNNKKAPRQNSGKFKGGEIGAKIAVQNELHKNLRLQTSSHTGSTQLKEQKSKKQGISIEDIARNAQIRGLEFEQTQGLFENEQEQAFLPVQSSQAVQNNRKQFYKTLRSVLNQADIILEVLDARDPLGTRSLTLERGARAKNKDLIIVLNKIDLVPRDIVHQWVEYLSNFFPSVAFKSVTKNTLFNNFNVNKLSEIEQGNINDYDKDENDKDNEDQPNLSIADSQGQKLHSNAIRLSHGESYGRDRLIDFIKSRSRSQGGQLLRSAVGVVGYPNVGKSSLINTLKRSEAVKTSSNPGCTRGTQAVKIDERLVLLDTPGVIFEFTGSRESRIKRGDRLMASARLGIVGVQGSIHQDNAGTQEAREVLRGAIKVDDVQDPVGAVMSLIARSDLQFLYKLYQIDSDTDELNEDMKQQIKEEGGMDKEIESNNELIKEEIDGIKEDDTNDDLTLMKPQKRNRQQFESQLKDESENVIIKEDDQNDSSGQKRVKYQDDNINETAQSQITSKYNASTSVALPFIPPDTYTSSSAKAPTTSSYSSAEEFLRKLCARFGKYKHGGSYNLEEGARIVLRDSMKGKIPFYTQPPHGPKIRSGKVVSSVDSAEVVEGFAPAFQVGDIQFGLGEDEDEDEVDEQEVKDMWES
ncbi:MAG: putative nuclear GTP-binding protein [Streblomastix strix]|uniref:Putative nuclear GTP-binding protein n=1 Tax=Streblomastix strix TaxID=222440 RepID=A0A5J4VYB8_9EUKA|nr:MAG: putative nuclear GTP-binding protein [Streblomastix strix]